MSLTKIKLLMYKALEILRMSLSTYIVSDSDLTKENSRIIAIQVILQNTLISQFIMSTVERKVCFPYWLLCVQIKWIFSDFIKKPFLLWSRNIKWCPSNYVISMEEVRPYTFSDQVIKSLCNKFFRMYVMILEWKHLKESLNV